MVMDNLVLLLLISCFPQITSTAIVAHPNGYQNYLMHLEEADIQIHFIGSFTVRHQIQCCIECVNGGTFGYALFVRKGKLCVCKTNFDWRRVVVGTIGVQRIELTPG